MDPHLYTAALGVARLLSGHNFSNLVLQLQRDLDATKLTELAEALPQRAQRDAVQQLASAWIRTGGTSEALLWCLLALRRRISEEPVTEMVWSGPPVRGAGYRSTEQVIREMLSVAVSEALIVSYAVRDVLALRTALVTALDRGVRVRMVLEHYDTMRGVAWDDKIQQLGQEILQRAEVFIWPLERRHRVGADIRGSLHAKCVVIDRMELLLTSANWTTAALENNIELGLRTTDGCTAEKACQQILGLIESKDLVLWRSPER